jgi:hypothetical protein
MQALENLGVAQDHAVPGGDARQNLGMKSRVLVARGHQRGADIVAETESVAQSRFDHPAAILVIDQRQAALRAFHMMHATRLPTRGGEVEVAFA